MPGDRAQPVFGTLVSILCSLVVATSCPAGSLVYQYDDLDRLERAIYQDGTALAYTYDNVGNRLAQEVVAVSVTPSPSGPADVGTTVTVQASVLGGSGEQHEFQFWRKRGANDPYLLVRDFGLGDNVVWYTDPGTNTLAETYRWRVLGRRIGSPLSYETFGEASYTLTVPPGGYYTAQSWGTAGDNVVVGDYDGDGKADVAVWRPSEGYFYILRSSDGTMQSQQWGGASFGDIALSGDYDGDRKADATVWRSTTGVWYTLRSSDGALQDKIIDTPEAGEVSVPADYDGDGKTDVATWRLSDGAWRILSSINGTTLGQPWGSGALGDIPVPGDYDGDGKADLAVWRPSDGYFYVLRSSDATTYSQQWGGGSLGDFPVPADYDGDRKTDCAVWRSAEGGWYILKSSTGEMFSAQWGSSTLGDVPVQGDYDGDGKADPAVWRPSVGVRYMRFF